MVLNTGTVTPDGLDKSGAWTEWIKQSAWWKGSLENYDSLSSIVLDNKISNGKELIEASIWFMDEWLLLDSGTALDMDIKIAEEKLVAFWWNWDEFKIASDNTLYEWDSLQEGKRALYEKSMYLKKLDAISRKLWAATTSVYERWDYKSLKTQWMDASKAAMIDWLKASLSLTGDKALERINRLNPIEYSKRCCAKKKLETVQELMDKWNLQSAALTLFSSYTVTNWIPLLKTMKKIKDFVSNLSVFGSNIGPLTINALNNMKKEYEKKRIPWDLYVNSVATAKKLYHWLLKQVWGSPDPSVITAFAKA